MQRTIQNICVCQSAWLFMSTRGKQSRSEEKSGSSVRGTVLSAVAVLVSFHPVTCCCSCVAGCSSVTRDGKWKSQPPVGTEQPVVFFSSYKMFSLTSAKLSFDLSSSWLTVSYDCRVGIHCCFPRLIFKVYSYLRI